MILPIVVLGSFFFFFLVTISLGSVYFKFEFFRVQFVCNAFVLYRDEK